MEELVFYDPHPTVCYRQHNDNLIGNNLGWKNRIARLRMLLHGRMRTWNNFNLFALSHVEPLLTPHNRKIFHQFSKARNSNLMSRVLGIAQSGIFRQTQWDNLALIVAAVLKKNLK